MIYQTVSHFRSGSQITHYTNRLYNNLNNLGVRNTNEVFLPETHLVDGQFIGSNYYNRSEKAIQEKIDFLIECRNKNIHFSSKVIATGVDKKYHDQIRNYLSHYKIITIKRNPFDMFLSFIYQYKTQWKKPHGAKSPLIETINLSLKEIDLFISLWSINEKFIRSCDIYHVFNYENLYEELNEFFSINVNEIIKLSNYNKPMKIDYRSLFTDDPQLIEEMFYDRFESKTQSI